MLPGANSSVAGQVADALEAVGVNQSASHQLGETLLQKIFFLTTFTLINEESNEVKADLEKTLKQLLLLELRDGRPVSFVSTATKWSEGDHPAHLALSSRLAALMAEQGFVAATVGVVKHLLLKLGDDDNGAVLLPAKCNTLDALSQLVKVCEGKNKDDKKAIALVDDRQDELANLLVVRAVEKFAADALVRAQAVQALAQPQSVLNAVVLGLD